MRLHKLVLLLFLLVIQGTHRKHRIMTL